MIERRWLSAQTTPPPTSIDSLQSPKAPLEPPSSLPLSGGAAPSPQVFVRTTTLMSPLGLLLFTGQPAMQKKMVGGRFSEDECTMRCGASGVAVDMYTMEGHALLKLRRALDSVLVQVSPVVVSGAASRQLVGSPPLGYPAGRVVT